MRDYVKPLGVLALAGYCLYVGALIGSVVTCIVAEWPRVRDFGKTHDKHGFRGGIVP